MANVLIVVNRRWCFGICFIYYSNAHQIIRNETTSPKFRISHSHNCECVSFHTLTTPTFSLNIDTCVCVCVLTPVQNYSLTPDHFVPVAYMITLMAHIWGFVKFSVSLSSRCCPSKRCWQTFWTTKLETTSLCGCGSN